MVSAARAQLLPLGELVYAFFGTHGAARTKVGAASARPVAPGCDQIARDTADSPRKSA